MYGPHNTLHVDDLARNFALNPANGIKIRAYREDMYATAHVLLQSCLFIDSE